MLSFFGTPQSSGFRSGAWVLTLPLWPLKERVPGEGGVKERWQILNLLDPIVNSRGWVSKSALVSGNLAAHGEKIASEKQLFMPL